MKTRNKNPVLQDLIKELNERKEPVWKAVARALNRPRRKRFEMNLYRIQKNASPKENIIVPGVVTGSDGIKDAFNIAALRFSEDARKAIESAKGKCFTIEQLVEKNPRRIRIMG